jgi:uncharacterized protein (TIGR02147 family)
MTITIYDYLDYREFLRALFAAKKAEDARFSHRSLAQHLGIKAPGHMLFVMQRKRNLSEELALRLSKYLKLKKPEIAYFLNLIKFNDARASHEKQYAFEQLQSVRRRGTSIVSPERYSFYEKWYYSAIRASLDVTPFSDDYRALGRSIKPSVTAQEAKESVALLARLGFIKRDARGFFHPSEPTISTGDAWQSAAITHLHRQFIALGGESLDRFPKGERDVSCLTVTLSPASLEKVRERIKSARAEILEIAASEPAADRVMQCNFQVFPLFIKDSQR